MSISHTAQLSRGQVHTVEARAGDTLRVVAGRLWVTQSGNEVDYFLHAGESLCLGLGRVVVEADGAHGAGYEVRSTSILQRFALFTRIGIS